MLKSTRYLSAALLMAFLFVVAAKGREGKATAGAANTSPNQAANASGLPILTLTAANLVFHQGEPVPPLIWSVSGFASGDTLANSVTGLPALSTAAQPWSRAGTYPVTISLAGMSSSNYRLTAVNGTIRVIPPDGYGAQLNYAPIHPDGFAPTAQSLCVAIGCTIYGEGVHDDTAAIQQLFSYYRPTEVDYSHSPLWVYFPAATYIMSGQINIYGCCIAIFGDGPGRTIFKIPAESSNCQGAAGSVSILNMPGYSANEGFREYLFDVTEDIGPGNPGCNAINYVGNNTAALRNDQLISEDSSAYAGLNLSSQYQGPEMFRNLEIWGFQRGINFAAYQVYNATFENITAEGQTAYGIYSGKTPYSMNGLLSDSAVPAVYNENSQIALINAEIFGGASGVSAIESGVGGSFPDSSMFTHNILESGSYQYTVYDDASGTPVTHGPGYVGESWTSPDQTLFSTVPPHSLDLPIVATPQPHDPPPNDWCELSTTDPASWQATMSGCTGPTVYLPAAVANITTTTTTDIVVPPNIDHIQFFAASVQPFDEYFNLEIQDDSATPLIIEGGYNIQVTHTGTRPVALVDTTVFYTSTSTGELFGDDSEWVGGTLTSGEASSSQGTTIVFNPGQRVWMRSFDIEGAFQPKAECNGCALWVLGLKSENIDTVLLTENGGQSEILGAGFYRDIASQPATSILIQGIDSNFSIAGAIQPVGGATNYGAGVLVDETCKGVDRQLLPAGGQTQNAYLPLFYSIGSC